MSLHSLCVILAHHTNKTLAYETIGSLLLFVGIGSFFVGIGVCESIAAVYRDLVWYCRLEAGGGGGADIRLVSARYGASTSG